VSASKQSPAVVIATRNKLIVEVGEVGGERLTQANRESIADWMIGSGYLAESYYEAVAAGIGDNE
jgi:hypothetical protein